jgi:hypothetical protein
MARCLRIGNGNNAITTRATTPSQRRQRRLALRTDDSGIRRKMLMNSFFFTESTVNRLDAMANNMPRWIGKET